MGAGWRLAPAMWDLPVGASFAHSHLPSSALLGWKKESWLMEEDTRCSSQWPASKRHMHSSEEHGWSQPQLM